MRARTWGGPAVAVGLVLAGCGGDDGPTKAEYVREANAICKRADAASQRTARERIARLGGSPTREQLVALVREVALPSIEGQLRDLRALDRPKDDADAVAEIYDALDGEIAKVRADPALAVAGNPFAGSSAKAHAYGLDACGRTQ
ncbi:hypothetical protein [Patulibacter defluvii]|uniref:hypothetical protein n=1 Tax=Patulibacter defluvii TaxID=3095358 RepID=UPI002A75C894|nr:hypothetical protein [Patulibacter sp. DM4]